MLFSDWSSNCISAKVGISDSGRAAEEISVARQSRRNSQTTNTASSAPSHSASMAASKPSSTQSVEEVTSLMVTPGCAAASAATLARAAWATSTSLDPTLR